MPECGSQLPLCDVPIRFDTYKGCTHACSYCFVNRKYDIKNIEMGESAQSLTNFIKGKRSLKTSWCDWDIPIHWGGVSDPFQPCEKIYKRSLEALKVFAETKYPYIVSTKSVLPATPEYLDVISKTNVVFQVSAVCSKYDEFEKGAPCFEERIKAVEKIVPNVKRLVIRVQPFVLEVEDDVIKNIPRYKNIGVYGIVLEGMKYRTKRPGTEKWYGDYVIKKSLLARSFERIKGCCHENGIVFLCGENRLRSMGDDLTCCGCGGLEGFKVNTYNQNSFNCGRKAELTEAQKKIGSATSFKALCQDHKFDMALKKMSFAEAMERYYRQHPDLVS